MFVANNDFFLINNFINIIYGNHIINNFKKIIHHNLILEVYRYNNRRDVGFYLSINKYIYINTYVNVYVFTTNKTNITSTKLLLLNYSTHFFKYYFYVVT